MVIIKSLSNKDYHAMEGLSKSKMDKLEISPAHYKASLEEPEKQTDALIFGSLFHTMVLEPEKIETEYAVEPVVNKRTNEGKQILSDFYEENKDKTIVTQEQMELAKTMAQKIYEHPIANKLLKAKGDCEISYFWNDDKTGVLLKARPDKVVDDIIIDVKTTVSANPNVFYKKAYDYGYHKQAAHFLDGYRACNGKNASGFIFIAVEKEPPYAVCVYKASKEFIEKGEIDVRKNIELFAECERTGIWRGYPEIIHELNLPRWAYNELMEEKYDE